MTPKKQYGLFVVVVLFLTVQSWLLAFEMREKNEQVAKLEERVVEQSILIEDLRTTNDQLSGDLNLAAETIEQLQN